MRSDSSCQSESNPVQQHRSRGYTPATVSSPLPPRNGTRKRVPFSFVMLGGGVVRQLANMPHEAVRVFWWLCDCGRWSKTTRTTSAEIAAELSLSVRQVKYAVRVLKRAQLVAVHNSGSAPRYTVMPPKPTNGFVRWSMGDEMRDIMRALHGSDALLYLVLTALTDGRPRDWPIATERLLEETGFSKTTFVLARLRLKQLKLISVTMRHRQTTRYTVHRVRSAVTPSELEMLAKKVGKKLKKPPSDRVQKVDSNGDKKRTLTVTKSAGHLDASSKQSARPTSLRSVGYVPTASQLVAPAAQSARRSVRMDRSCEPSKKQQHETLHKALRALGMSPISPQSIYGQRALASLRARIREGFTIEDCLAAATQAGIERAESIASGGARYVRKYRNLCFVWGMELVGLLEDSKRPAVEAPTPIERAGMYRIEDPEQRAKWLAKSIADRQLGIEEFDRKHGLL